MGESIQDYTDSYYNVVIGEVGGGSLYKTTLTPSNIMLNPHSCGKKLVIFHFAHFFFFYSSPLFFPTITSCTCIDSLRGMQFDSTSVS